MKAKRVPIILGKDYLEWIFDYDFFKQMAYYDRSMFFGMLIDGCKPIAKELKTLGDVLGRFNLLPLRYIVNEDEVLAAYPSLFEDTDDGEISGVNSILDEKIPVVWKFD